MVSVCLYGNFVNIIKDHPIIPPTAVHYPPTAKYTNQPPQIHLSCTHLHLTVRAPTVKYGPIPGQHDLSILSLHQDQPRSTCISQAHHPANACI